jgi:hypothetical protein
MNESRVQRRRKQFLAVLGSDVDEIAEHVIVPDFQRADAGRLGVAHLQRGDDAAGFVAQRARLVEGRLKTGAHETAVTPRSWKFVAQRPIELGGERTVRLAQRFRRASKIARQFTQRRYPLGDRC